MTPELVIDIGEQALKMVALISAPLLFSALIIGLIVGMFQAATSINEQTLSFIPKLIILVVALFVAGPWMLQLMINFTRRLYENIPNMIG
jgi:flagellar biosynthetic protein FliQ